MSSSRIVLPDLKEDEHTSLADNLGYALREKNEFPRHLEIDPDKRVKEKPFEPMTVDIKDIKRYIHFDDSSYEADPEKDNNDSYLKE